MKSKIKKPRHRGALSTGMGFALIAIFSVVGLGALMVGNITPLSSSNSSQPVIVLTATPEPTKDNLQLYTFPAITLTATPQPTNPPQPQEKGGFNYGEPTQSPGGSFPGGGGSGGGGGGAAI